MPDDVGSVDDVFQRAGALVTDAGSVLSHTAIVAREFGLPAVGDGECDVLVEGR